MKKKTQKEQIKSAFKGLVKALRYVEAVEAYDDPPFDLEEQTRQDTIDAINSALDDMGVERRYM